jgi:membrane-bound lytic murein transglycosylase A
MPDHRVWFRRLGALGACLSLAACATPRYPIAPTPVPSRPSYAPPVTPAPLATPTVGRLSDLPGWDAEDHAAAFRAFQDGCRVTRDPALYDLCHQARALGRLDEDAARAFLETHFRPRAVAVEGVLTGYFVPEYEAREDRDPPFTAAVRPKPADLPPAGGAYADRAAIEAQDPPPGQALAWMRPEDLFFMQIQGSGVLDLPDGRRLKASFAASNGAPFTPIAAPLRARGALAAAGSSGEAIRAWLADHRGPEADAVMQLNARYVFFTVAPDDGAEPAGTAGLPLTPGRALAVDQSLHPLGGLYWIDADAPTLNGAAPVYRRLAMALDTGGAIKGPARADLYIGRGPAAGVEAGHIRHTLRLYELTPVTEPGR